MIFENVTITLLYILLVRSFNSNQPKIHSTIDEVLADFKIWDFAGDESETVFYRFLREEIMNGTPIPIMSPLANRSEP